MISPRLRDAARFWLPALLGLFPWLFSPSGLCRASETPGSGYYFYRDVPYGSDSQFNPIQSFTNYSLDSLQVSESFRGGGLENQFDDTFENLTNPIDAISDEGGFVHFVNRQVLPVDFDNLGDSTEMLPNYALHLLGGGMLYRKNAEWFHAHGYRYPRAYSLVMAMLAEFTQEVIEKESTADDDPVADFWIFRPAGILLFSWDPVARFFAETMGMVEWPYQAMFDVDAGEFRNVGQSFAVRPSLFGTSTHRPFIYFGIATLFGLSHRIGTADGLSWGAGAAVVDAEEGDVRLRPTGGLFYDRTDSLLASIMINGTDDLAVRCNVHPGVIIGGRWSPGVFVGVGDDGGVSAGVTLRLTPVGGGAEF
jgi:hypothetical protein